MFRDVLRLLEPRQTVKERVSQGFFQRHPSVRLVLQHPGDEVQHDALLLAEDGVGAGPPVLGERPTVLGGVPGCWQRPVPAQPPRPCMEEAGFGSPDYVRREVSEYSGHHGEVLHVVVSLEQSVALQERRDKGRAS